MSEQTDGTGREWITLGDFARRLGIARASVYGRIKRGTLDAKRANRGGYLVPWPPPDHDGSSDTASTVALQTGNGSGDGSATVADELLALRVEVARLEERLVVREEIAAKMEAELRHTLAAERARGDRLEAALAEARRPWLARLLASIRRT